MGNLIVVQSFLLTANQKDDCVEKQRQRKRERVQHLISRLKQGGCNYSCSTSQHPFPPVRKFPLNAIRNRQANRKETNLVESRPGEEAAEPEPEAEAEPVTEPEPVKQVAAASSQTVTCARCKLSVLKEEREAGKQVKVGGRGLGQRLTETLASANMGNDTRKSLVNNSLDASLCVCVKWPLLSTSSSSSSAPSSSSRESKREREREEDGAAEDLRYASLF